MTLSSQKPASTPSVRCSDYSLEMTLVSLRRQLAGASLEDRERNALLARIREIEAALGMD